MRSTRTKQYIGGADACVVNLMRPAMYGVYHHITVMGKEDAPCEYMYDVAGSLCENNDKLPLTACFKDRERRPRLYP